MKITFENSTAETIAFFNTIDNFVNAMAANESDSRRGRVVEHLVDNVMHIVGKLDLSNPKTKEAVNTAVNEVIGKFYVPKNEEEEDHDADTSEDEDDYDEGTEEQFDDSDEDDGFEEPNPWNNINDYYQIGDVVTGKVTKITCFGAFIELAHKIEGLVHISHVSKDPGFDGDIHDILSVGDKITAVVLYVNCEEHRIGLSIRECPEQPDYPGENAVSGDNPKWTWEDVRNWAESTTVIPLSPTLRQLCDALGGFPIDKFPEELKLSADGTIPLSDLKRISKIVGGRWIVDLKDHLTPLENIHLSPIAHFDPKA